MTTQSMKPHNTTTEDLERAGGYTAAAAWLARDPDNEPFVFRKFDKLAALNLLCLQSELLDLEQQLSDMHEATIRSDDMRLRAAASKWETLMSHASSDQHPAAVPRLRLILEIRSKVKEYHEALLLQSHVANLRRPDGRVLDALADFFGGPNSPHHPILGGKAKRFLEEVDDLISVKQTENVDHLSSFLRRHLGKADTYADGSKSRYARFRENTVDLIVKIVNIVAAAVFLVGSMFTLYFIESRLSKLGAITVYMSGFAITVGLITNARRVEIFAATAAYAAVLVVFISTEPSPSKPSD